MHSTLLYIQDICILLYSIYRIYAFYSTLYTRYIYIQDICILLYSIYRIYIYRIYAFYSTLYTGYILLYSIYILYILLLLYILFFLSQIIIDIAFITRENMNTVVIHVSYRPIYIISRSVLWKTSRISSTIPAIQLIIFSGIGSDGYLVS